MNDILRRIETKRHINCIKYDIVGRIETKRHINCIKDRKDSIIHSIRWRNR